MPFNCLRRLISNFRNGSLLTFKCLSSLDVTSPSVTYEYEIINALNFLSFVEDGI